MVHFEDASYEDREERFCDVFGTCLLMPGASVRKKAAELKRLVGRFTVRELLTMTLYFNVSMEALVRSRLLRACIHSSRLVSRDRPR